MSKYLLFFLFGSTFVIAQELNNKLSITLENDKIVLLDQYYTSGILLDYAHVLEQDFSFFDTENSKLQLEFCLAQQTFTPFNLTSINTRDFDRPYAGWLGLSANLRQIKERQATVFGVEIGVSGKQSFAGDLQTWWHNMLEIAKPTWEQEIGNKFLINFSAKYLYNLFTRRNAAIDFNLETVLGLKDVNLSTGIDLVLGRIKTFNSASRVNIIESSLKSEFYGVLGLAIKYVVHNTLIQGDLRYDDRLFTSNITNEIITFKTGINYKNRRNLISLHCFLLSKESPQANNHIYGSLSYGLQF